jgi:lipid-A-disaccharide synthase
MKTKSIMLIAGEASGDALGAQLVDALRAELTAADVSYTPDPQPLRTGLEPRFFGGGGPRMAAAGVELAFDLTEDSVTGLPTLKEYLAARRRFNELLRLAIERQPDVIVGIDYNYFNLQFAQIIRKYARQHRGWFQDWQPKLVKFVSPQIWASREDRAFKMERDFDLLLSTFPFEKAWYAAKVPKFRVEFVGHPMLDRLGKPEIISPKSSSTPLILLLPGSREGEVKNHVPVMLRALNLIRRQMPGAKAKMVSPNKTLAELAKTLGMDCEIQIGDLPRAVAQADIAIASTGTVTMECALFGLPSVTLYKKALLGVALRTGIIKTKWFTMPNILAKEEVFPEFLQSAATPKNIAQAALDLLTDETRRRSMQATLAEKVIAPLGGPGASRHAARAIVELLEPRRIRD